MTRINVIPVEELSDKHLLAEFRELPRIPNAVKSLRFNCNNMPSEYTLGTGHVKFFYKRLGYLKSRYNELYAECLFRGFAVTYYYDLFEPLQSSDYLFGDYEPTDEAIVINRERIIDRFPSDCRFTKRNIPLWVLRVMQRKLNT